MKAFNNSVSELKDGGRREWEEEGGVGSNFYRGALFHRFISSSYWMMEHTFGFGVEQLEQPKGRKKM